MLSPAYQRLALRLDELPNGYPPTDEGVELRLLALIFTPEEAELAAGLGLRLQSPEQIAERLGGDSKVLRDQLKSMARRGLINAGKLEGGMGYGLMPFAVGIYEMQVGRLDAEFAALFEAYYKQVFGQVLTMQPSVHRVIPVGETVKMGMEIRPYESAAQIVDDARAWGVVDCICRKQKALVGEPCEHPLDVCMVVSQRPGAFDQSSTVRALTQGQAHGTLHRAAKAGLVHSVSNTQQGVWYICNCCTCSCGILRGMADLGLANVVAHSAFVNRVDDDLCIACEDCLDSCQFDALTMDLVAQVDEVHCVGCGVCVLACPESALGLVRRPLEEVTSVPESEMDWLKQRALSRGMDLTSVL